MNQLADDVWQIPLAPRNGVNAYLVGDVLVDAGYIRPGRRSSSGGRAGTRSARTR